MIFVYHLVFIIVLLYSTYGFYAAIMALRKAEVEQGLTPAMKVLGVPLLLVGLILDFTLNMLASFIFLEFPREALLSPRLTRHKRDNPDNWRGKIAMWICSQLLDRLDPSGCHCRIEDL